MSNLPVNVIDLSAKREEKAAEHHCPGCDVVVPDGDYTCKSFPKCNADMTPIDAPDIAAAYHRLSLAVGKEMGMIDKRQPEKHLSELPEPVQHLMVFTIMELLAQGIIMPGAINVTGND